MAQAEVEAAVPVPEQPRFAVPASAPVGVPRTIPPRPVAAGDRRTVTMIDRSWPGDGEPYRTTRIEVAEQVASVRHGREHLGRLAIVDAHVLHETTPPTSEPFPLRGTYLRLAEPIMLEDVGVHVQFFKGAAPVPAERGRFEHREHQALHDLHAEELNVELVLAALRELPLRVGETVMPLRPAWTSHMVLPTIHRRPDLDGAARYVLVTDTGDRRFILAVDAQGRPVMAVMDFAGGRSTLALIYRYPG